MQKCPTEDTVEHFWNYICLLYDMCVHVVGNNISLGDVNFF